MAAPATRTVVDCHGVHGMLLEDAERPTKAGEVLVRLDDGREVMVPRGALATQPDGSFHVAHSFEDLARIKSDAVTIPVVEETVRVHKREIVTGRMRVSKRVHEREETIDEPLLREEVQVERIPIGRWIDGPVEARYEGDTL